MPADEVEIVPYQDGPYLVRGPAVLRDQDGREIYAGRRTIALCRCGKSRMRPFCDGTHQLIRFKAASEPEQKRPYGLRGGAAATNGSASRSMARVDGTVHTHLQEADANIRRLASRDDSIMHAVSLLSATRVLLAAGPPSPSDGEDPDWATPCVCLLRATIAALTKGTERAVPDVSNVIEQLAVLVAQLETRGGHA